MSKDYINHQQLKKLLIISILELGNTKKQKLVKAGGEGGESRNVEVL